MQTLTLRSIGTLRCDENGFRAVLLPAFRAALAGLDGFSHVQLIWWFDGCDNENARQSLTERKPYIGGPETLGTFATRSPARPNPLALTCAEVLSVDHEAGVIELSYVDAENGSPLLDIKPYTPSLDRVERPAVPAWCGSWPDCVERSGAFDWQSVFNF